MIQKIKLSIVIIVSSLLTLASAVVSVLLIPLVSPPFDGIQACNSHGCFPLLIQITDGKVLPVIRSEPFFLIFVLGFATGIILLFIILGSVNRWLPKKRVVVWQDA